MAYAHAVIENPEDGTKYQRGDEVPADLPGYDELVEGGSISDEEYVPEPNDMLADVDLRNVVEVDDQTVIIDGVTYKKTSDTSEANDARS